MFLIDFDAFLIPFAVASSQLFVELDNISITFNTAIVCYNLFKGKYCQHL